MFFGKQTIIFKNNATYFTLYQNKGFVLAFMVKKCHNITKIIIVLMQNVKALNVRDFHLEFICIRLSSYSYRKLTIKGTMS